MLKLKGKKFAVSELSVKGLRQPYQAIDAAGCLHVTIQLCMANRSAALVLNECNIRSLKEEGALAPQERLLPP